MGAFSFPAFNPSPSATSTTWRNQNLLLLGTPIAGTYASATVLVDWVGGGVNSQWSNEAQVAFGTVNGTGSGSSGAPPTFTGGSALTPVAPTSNGASNGNNINNLQLTAGFTNPYTSGPLVLSFGQNFGGTNANWTNVRVTLNDLITPTSTPISNPGSVSTTIVAGQVVWASFVVATAGSYNVNTSSSNIGATAPLNDTEIGLFNSNGGLIGANDDIGGGNNLSSFTASLTPGTYYVAAAGFNAAFASGFTATTTGTQTGSLVINVLIPEPTTMLSLAGLGAIAMHRRRVR